MLGVSPRTCDNKVKKVYLKLARQYHPDYGGSDEQMAVINTAYEQAKQVSYKVQL
ncbi:J domain-containing protein [Nostoc sp. LPT]|uniref:J domain-containing protein n=1 Tax=Nostoc sp. LPT TaxID=2815387 RepID=UPI001D3A31E8|nr:J domain-containing protein [Nostoc sp. LPT]MBN4003567.1 J domain-containing protein [Nostoc sp. LPT]